MLLSYAILLTVPGHSCWPQNGPFDANLAHLLSCNTASLCKNTTHKTPQSAGRFVIWLSANKWHFLFRHLVMIGVTTDTFCVDFWRFLLRSRTISAKHRVHRLSSSFQDGFAGQERDHLPDQISHTPWAEPGNVAKPRTILYDMLSMARSVSQPGLVIELPYRWRRETYPPIVDWTAESGAAVSVPQTKSFFGNHMRY